MFIRISCELFRWKVGAKAYSQNWMGAMTGFSSTGSATELW